MPVNPTYPGVYIQEIPSGVRTITGVATSITAFIGRALRGPTNKAITITSYSDFERTFGGLWVESTLGYAVRDFYLNGGSTAIIVRLFHPNKATFDAGITDANKAAQAVIDKINASTGATAADIAKDGTDEAATINSDTKRSTEAKAVAIAVAKAGADAAAKDRASKDSIVKAAQDSQASVVNSNIPLTRMPLTVGELPLEAAYEGSWGNTLTASIDNNVSADFAKTIGLTADDLFNLTVQEGSNGTPEVFRNLTLKNSSRRIDKVLEADSRLVRWVGPVPPLPDPLLVIKKQFTTDTNPPKVILDDKSKAIADAQTDVKNKKKELDDKQKALDNAADAGKPAATTARDNAKTALDAANTALNAAENTPSATDGDPIDATDFVGTDYQDQKIGLYALEQADLFNILCIPPFVLNGDAYDMDVTLLAPAATYCTDRRAVLLVDPQSAWEDRDAALKGVQDIVTEIGSDNAKNAAFYFPRLQEANILHNNLIESFVPCGAMAGIFARTDTQRGVWKAPAGLEASITGASGLDVLLTDNENGLLNPHAVNCLRVFPAAGIVVWGARTLAGDDQLASEWKYISVRRTALFIEESLYRGTKWVVFEPNDEPLWAQIRLNVGAFMQNLFRQGAFQGQSPRDAYFVKCDKETTTQNDINLGIVNIIVGFAPLKPAEFVIVKIQQIAGQIQV